MTLTRSVNKSYGFTVVANKMDNLLYVAEILGEPALSDGRLRRGDRLLMVKKHFRSFIALICNWFLNKWAIKLTGIDGSSWIFH